LPGGLARGRAAAGLPPVELPMEPLAEAATAVPLLLSEEGQALEQSQPLAGRVWRHRCSVFE
jgi:hypothetical protein